MTPTHEHIPARQSPGDRAMEAAVARALFGDASQTAARIGRYVVLEAIGSGGMGRVYLAYDPQLDRRVALKLMHPRVEEDLAGADRRLDKEAKALARLNHPNVVTVFEVGLEGAERFIAMEHVQGQHLAQWADAHPVPTPWRTDRRLHEALSILRQATLGLAAAHEVGLIHRDFKPSNVLLGDDGRVRVADFGLARVAAPGATRGGLPSGHGEASTTTIAGGTPRYMAPEQADGRSVDARADQYALCVTAWEVLFGEHPRSEDDEGTRRPAPSGAPPGLVRMLERGMQDDPARRFESLAQLLEAWPRTAPASRRAWLLASGAVAVAVVASLGWWQAIERDEPNPCDGITARMDDAWNADEASRLRSAFLATDLPFAEPAAAQATSNLDDYAREWNETRVQLCEAGRSLPPGAIGLHERQVLCLDRSVRSVEATVSALQDPPASAIERIGDVRAHLPAFARCARPDALTFAVPLPADPEQHRLIDEIQAAVADASARRMLGDYAGEHGLLAEVGEQVEQVTHVPTKALWTSAMALNANERGETEMSLELARLAIDLAIRGHAMTTASGAATLIATIRREREQYDEASEWARLAASFAKGQADGDRPLAWAYGELGISEAAAGRVEAAVEAFERALSHEPPGTSAHVDLFSNMVASAYLANGRWKDGEAKLRQVLAAQRALHGDASPKVAHELTNLGNVLAKTGRFAEAETALQEAIDIFEAAYGPRYRKLAPPLQGLVIVAHRQGDLDKAVAAQRRALDLLTALHGVSHPRTLRTKAALITDLVSAGSNDAAAQLAAELLEQAAAAESDDPLLYAFIVSGAARGLLASQPDHAAALVRRAVAGLGAPGPAVRRFEPIPGLMYAISQLELHADAVALGQEHDALIAENPYLESGRTGFVRFGYAKGLYGSGERSAGIAEARRALEIIERHGAPFPDAAEQIETWLAANG